MRWRPSCRPMTTGRPVNAGQGRLELIDERPDPIFGVLGMTCQTLKCDFLECGKLTIV